MCWYRLYCLWLQNSDCLLLPQIAMLVSGLPGRSRSIYPVSVPVLCLWLGRDTVFQEDIQPWCSPQPPDQELELFTTTDSHLEVQPWPRYKVSQISDIVPSSMLGRALWIFCCFHVQADIRHGSSARECTLVGWFSQQILYLVFKYIYRHYKLFLSFSCLLVYALQ